MKPLLPTLFLLFSTHCFAFGGKEYNYSYAANRDPFQDFRQAQSDARSSNTLILISMGGDWCGWCRRLEAFINDNQTLRNQLDHTFTVMKLGINEENNNATKDFINLMPRAKGYPFFVVADQSGNILDTHNTGLLKTDKQYSEEKFMHFLNMWKSRILH